MASALFAPQDPNDLMTALGGTTPQALQMPAMPTLPTAQPSKAVKKPISKLALRALKTEPSMVPSNPIDTYKQDVAKAESEIKPKIAESESKVADLRTQRAKAGEESQAGIQAARDAEKDVLGQSAHVEHPDFIPQQIEPKQAKEIFTSMTLWAILGGMLTKAPLTAALNNMTGIMEGVQSKNKELYDRSYKEWQANIKKAEDLQHEKEAELDRAWKRANATLNERIHSAELVYRKYEDEIGAEMLHQGKLTDELHKRTQESQHFMDSTMKAKDFEQKIEEQRQSHHDMMELKMATLQQGGAGGMRGASQQQGYAMVATEASLNVATDLKSISSIVGDTSMTTLTGILSKPAADMYGAARKLAADKLNSEQSALLGIYTSGMIKDMAAASGGGRPMMATQGKILEMHGLLPKEGEDRLIIWAGSLARLKAEMQTVNKSMQTNPYALPEQKALIAGAVQNIEKSIDWSQEDVIHALSLGQSDKRSLGRRIDDKLGASKSAPITVKPATMTQGEWDELLALRAKNGTQ